MKQQTENTTQGVRSPKTHRKILETRKHIAEKNEHEARLQQIMHTKPDCNEKETRKQIARKNKHENGLH